MGIPHFVRDDNLILIKEVSGENFTGKILTANLLDQSQNCHPERSEGSPGVQLEVVIGLRGHKCIRTRNDG